jgi:hypothetical protein
VRGHHECSGCVGTSSRCVSAATAATVVECRQILLTAQVRILMLTVLLLSLECVHMMYIHQMLHVDVMV